MLLSTGCWYHDELSMVVLGFSLLVGLQQVEVVATAAHIVDTMISIHRQC
jgi:hypothetical protein